MICLSLYYEVIILPCCGLRVCEQQGNGSWVMSKYLGTSVTVELYCYWYWLNWVLCIVLGTCTCSSPRPVARAGGQALDNLGPSHFFLACLPVCLPTLAKPAAFHEARSIGIQSSNIGNKLNPLDTPSRTHLEHCCLSLLSTLYHPKPLVTCTPPYHPHDYYSLL